MEEMKNIVVVDEFNGKYKINEHYKPIAKALKEKFKELEYVPVDNILFVENTEDKRKNNNMTVYAQISKVPGRWEDLIYQMTKKQFEYMLEIYKENTREMSRQQIVALIYHELKHIQLVKSAQGPKVDIVGHDVEDWFNMIEKLGSNWNSTKATIPNLLDDSINWDSIEGPARIFPTEAILKVVK